MLVKYKIAGGAYTLLFDESAGDANEKFAPSFRDALQKVQGYGAANAVKIPQSNTDGHVQFKWSSNYASAAAALAAIATLRATFKGVTCHLQVTVGATVVYLPNATLASSTHDPHGCECAHTLDFDCDDITTTAP
ncbi:MAG TPA: hypothetical protein VF988_16770 [Verrucomicrobiae bacterium]